MRAHAEAMARGEPVVPRPEHGLHGAHRGHAARAGRVLRQRMPPLPLPGSRAAPGRAPTDLIAVPGKAESFRCGRIHRRARRVVDVHAGSLMRAWTHRSRSPCTRPWCARPPRWRRRGGVPAAMSASRQPSLLRVMNSLPASDATHCSTSAGSTGSPRVEVHAQPDQREIPTDADRARSELGPVIVDRQRVHELETGVAVRPQPSTGARSG